MMDFFNKIKGEFIDIIEFLDNNQNTIVHRFERYQNEIKNNAKLVVREGQIAVFINEGLKQSERLEKLNKIAISQMQILNDTDIKYLK